MRIDRLSTTIDLILLMLFTVSSIFFCIQVYLTHAISFGILTLSILFVIAIIIGLFIWILIKKKPILRKVIMVLLTIVLFVFSLYLANLRKKDSESVSLYTNYQLNLVVDAKKYENTFELLNRNIGVLSTDQNHLDYFDDLNSAFGMKDCVIVQFQSISNMLKALKENTIQGLILSDHNLEIVNQTEPYSELTVLKTNYHSVPISHSNPTKTLNEPFSALFIVSNSNFPTNYVSKSDKYMMLFVDPITKTMRLVEIPHNLYVPNVAYNSYPDALYNVSYNGVDNVLYTLKSTFGFEPDFFVKMNSDTIYNIANIFQSVKLSIEECENEGCSVVEKSYRAEELMNYYQQENNLIEIFKAFFNKKNELDGAKLINFLNNLKTNAFTNMNLNDLRTFISTISKDSEWNIETHEFSLSAYNAPCISFDFYKNSVVSIADAQFIEDIYKFYIETKHLERMNNFEFNLNNIHADAIYPPFHEKLITTDNIGWKIDELFSILPESSVNPIEVEKWQGDTTFDQPNFDPNDSIEFLE